MSVTVPEQPVLATLPRVELMHAGTWDLSTGPATFTKEDLSNAVSAMDCPAVRRPVLKLGHVDERFDGEPAVGWIGNLSTDGSTLWGDYTGMPRWLADVCASAYPDRSIEGWYDFQCQLGHTHPFVLTGVALLGVAAPGIGTLQSLQDVAALYGVAASQEPGEGRPFSVIATGGRMAKSVKASASTEDIRRAFYAQAEWDEWITEIQIDPLQIIVMEDGNGSLKRVPVTVDSTKDGDEAISFGEATPVIIRYEDVAAAQVAASAPIRYATRSESRASVATDSPATVPGETPTKEETAMADTLKTGLQEMLNLGTETELDDEAVLAALGERLTTPVSASIATPDIPEDKVLVSKVQLEELRVGAAAGKEALRRQQAEDRDKALATAVAEGRISPARRAAWATAWDKDPEGTQKDLSELPADRIPMASRGHAGGSEGDESNVIYSNLFGQEA